MTRIYNRCLANQLAITCILALSAFSTHAAAPPAREAPVVTRTVRFGDLDLSTAAGQKALQARIDTAAKQICRETVWPIPGLLVQNGICRDTLRKQTLALIAGRTIPANGSFVTRLDDKQIQLGATSRIASAAD